MERLKCKACGCYGMVPMEVATDEEQDDLTQLMGADPESRFYTCHVCGDNWLSVKEVEGSGNCKVTFVHQMGMTPVLKRTAHLTNTVVLTENAVEKWNYFLDDQEIDQEVWFSKLEKRRHILKSICTN